jgi:hypothetical protein
MSTTPSTGPQTPGGMPPAAPAQKSNALLWILGGCGTLIVICIIAFVAFGFYVKHKAEQAGFDPALMKKNPALAAAKMAVAANPDTEVVSSNDSAGTIVVRDKKSGKVSTMKFDPEKRTMVITDEKGKETTITGNESGNMEIKGPDGSMKIGVNSDKAPDWVPVYPGSSPQSGMSMNSGDEQGGTFGFNTSDSSEKVMSFYGDQLKAAGLKVSSTSNNTDGKIAGLISASDKDSKRTVVVAVTPDDKGTGVSVTYSVKK